MSELWALNATELTELVRLGKASAVEVTESALARLADVNPAVNAVVAEMPDEAISAARAIDAAIARGCRPGPLAGVPITVKVNVDQRGHATTNGLRLQRQFVAKEDNPVVANLRKAGAIIVGRTNTPAFSLRWFTRNSLHGHTLNPRCDGLTPGGSSGGAASAVAVGIGALGHGTDIGGSIRYPAYACGVHGLRPTLGRVPAANFTTPDRQIGAQLMAVSGPIARSVRDLELGLRAMSAEDQRDPWWTPAPLAFEPQSLRAALCVAPEGLQVAPAVEDALRDAAERLRDAGWTVDEVDSPPFREPARLQGILWMAEFRRGGADMVTREGDSDASFVYEQLAAACPEANSSAVQDALQRRVALCRQWLAFCEEYPVLLCPVSAELPFADLLDIESPASFSRILEAQLTQLGLPFVGLPGLTVSTRLLDNVPVGVQLIAGRFRECALLRAGEDIERRGTPPSPIDPVKPRSASASR